MLYDLTFLALLPNTLGAVMPLLPETYKNFSKTGTTLGAFTCEFGVLNRFAFLTSYDSAEALAKERARLMQTEDAYGIGKYIGGISSTAFSPLSFAKPIVPGTYGPFYEFRTYTIAPGGLPETEEAWGKIIGRRNAISPLLTNMVSIEGAPTKMVHIWPYNSLEDRVKARSQASKEGIWPPPGGSGYLTSLQSELFVATSFSGVK
ncbi:NIPSNAP family protein [uncultured Devosia sp.]|uniref:NIPSNAP family protein n=1 Tax=uncultured Devosia sp. TaxID=211434 RepID=UPI0035CBF8DD